MSDVLIRAKGLSVGFPIGGGILRKQILKAVDNVSLDIEAGSFFGLVGESGSGKTTLGRALLKAAPITSGGAQYTDGEVSYDLENISKDQLRDYRKRAQLIFQDPYAALSPRMTVRDIIAEPLEVMGLTKNRQETDARARNRCEMPVEPRTPPPLPARFFGWSASAHFHSARAGLGAKVHRCG